MPSGPKGLPGPCHIGCVLTLPRTHFSRQVRQRVINRVMQPSVPFRRNLGGFISPLKHTPPLLPTPPGLFLGSIVPIAKLVDTDKFSSDPSMNDRTQFHSRCSLCTDTLNWHRTMAFQREIVQHLTGSLGEDGNPATCRLVTPKVPSRWRDPIFSKLDFI